MDWVQIASLTAEYPLPPKRLERFTLYDHVYYADYDEAGRKFTCLLNCKKLSRLYSTICEISGDYQQRHVSIACFLLGPDNIVCGKWQYQKIELARFASRYNQSSFKNIAIKVDPRSGEVYVVLGFSIAPGILEDQVRARQLLTDLCQSVGQESQKIFNTMSEIIFGRQANEPYLKSAIKVNPSFPRYMKVQKLLDKIKSLIATSSNYKIKSDIASAHQNRSYFKKIYLNQDKKLITNPKIVQMALAYQPKFNKKYDEPQRKVQYKPVQFIKDYIQLQEKNQIEFAKHLNQGSQAQYTQPIIEIAKIVRIVKRLENIIEVQIQGGRKVEVVVHRFQHEEYQHQVAILRRIGVRHPFLPAYLVPQGLPEFKDCLFTLYEQEIRVEDYLKRNKRVVSLSTRLQIMSQVCSVMQFLHKRNVGLFLQPQNVWIARGLEVRVRGFRCAYGVKEWIDPRKQQGGKILDFLLNEADYYYFPYRFICFRELESQKSDVYALGVTLYRIIMDKFPFDEASLRQQAKDSGASEWKRYWVVQTEYFLMQGGQIVKMIAHLLLKCLDIGNFGSRPYVQWLVVILCEIKTSLNGLY